MSIIVIPFTFTVGAVIIAAQHNSNFSTIYNDHNGNITTANLSASAGIVDSQLAQITTFGKVSGASLSLLGNVNSGAGLIPPVNVFPSGMIVMWSGTIATIPSGWVLCNGSNSTPDLRNRFVVCADADVSSIAKSTITGSALQTSEGQLPSTTVNLSKGFANSGGSFGNSLPTDGNATPDGNLTISFGTGTANVSRFYALAYIMKT